MKVYAWFLVCLLLCLTSCRSSAPAYPYRDLARAGIALGVDIAMSDNHRLYVESSEWIGTPYRYGGNSRRGTDCSGFTAALYKKVYRTRLPRSTREQYETCRRVRRRSLQEGDLVFFYDTRSKRVPMHVGVYLKEGKFIHASSSQGVIVSSLEEEYYRKRWLSGGKP